MPDEHIWKHHIPLRDKPYDELTPYERAFSEGEYLARRVMDLDMYTVMSRHYPNRVPDRVPMDEQTRRGWLRGCAWGILSVTDER